MAAPRDHKGWGSALVMTLYLLFLLVPIYWLVNMSFKTNAEITGDFSLFPRNLTSPITAPS